jgi:tetratricopeptide (TPR) repeat protein
LKFAPTAEEVRQLFKSAAASGDVDQMLHAGAVALQANAQSVALRPVREMLHRHPCNARLWQLLGLLNRDLHDLRASIDSFAKAAELLPDDPMITNGYACVALEAGLPAVALFESAIRAAPNDRELHLRLAAARIDQGEAEKAIAGLEEAVARYPDWTTAQRRLAQLKWAHGDSDRFAEGFERALAASPRNADLWQAYADLMVQDQLQHRAVEVVTRARAVVGPLPGLDAVEAIARAEMRQMDLAKAVFPRALTTGRLDVVVAFIRFLLRNGLPKEAAVVAENNLAAAGNHLWPYLSIAWRMLGDPRWEWLEGDPRFIGVYDLVDNLPDLGDLAARLRARHRSKDAPLDQSLRGGTQTEGNLLLPMRAEFSDLREAMVAAVERYVEQLPAPREDHPLLLAKRSQIRFSGSWSVRLTDGGRHGDHVHPAGWISSALYVVLPGESERGGGESGWLSLGEARDIADVPPIRVVEPKPGRLVLFPSTMWHGTRPFKGGERLTVAFDVERPR